MKSKSEIIEKLKEYEDIAHKECFLMHQTYNDDDNNSFYHQEKWHLYEGKAELLYWVLGEDFSRYGYGTNNLTFSTLGDFWRSKGFIKAKENEKSK